MTDKDTAFQNLAAGLASLIKELLTGKATVRTVFYGLPTVYSPFALAMAVYDKQHEYLWLGSIAVVTFVCYAASEFVGAKLTGVDVTKKVKEWAAEEKAANQTTAENTPVKKYSEWPGVIYTEWKGADACIIDPKAVYEGRLKLINTTVTQGKWPINLLTIQDNDHPEEYLVAAMFEPTTGIVWSLNDDPWGDKHIPTPEEIWEQVLKSEHPCAYLCEKYGQAAEELFVDSKVKATGSQQLYDMALERAKLHGKEWLPVCRGVFYVITKWMPPEVSEETKK
jgi:hypothetical protein